VLDSKELSDFLFGHNILPDGINAFESTAGEDRQLSVVKVQLVS